MEGTGDFPFCRAECSLFRETTTVGEPQITGLKSWAIEKTELWMVLDGCVWLWATVARALPGSRHCPKDPPWPKNPSAGLRPDTVATHVARVGCAALARNL